MKHFLNAFENYANFSGRASVSQYWTFYIISCLIGFIPVINIIYILASIIPSLSILVRRLHDSGHSGSYIFLILIPIVGWIWLLILLLKEGDVSINKYGKPISSSNGSTSSKHEEVFGHDFKSKSDTENRMSSKPKVYTDAPKKAFNANKESITEKIDGIKVSKGTSQLAEIEKIERQYEKEVITSDDIKKNIINETQIITQDIISSETETIASSKDDQESVDNETIKIAEINTNKINIIDDEINDFKKEIDNIKDEFENAVFSQSEMTQFIGAINDKINELEANKNEVLRENWLNEIYVQFENYIESFELKLSEKTNNLKNLCDKGILDYELLEEKVTIVRNSLVYEFQKNINFKSYNGLKIYVGRTLNYDNNDGVIVEVIDMYKIVLLLDDKHVVCKIDDCKESDNVIKLVDGEYKKINDNNFLVVGRRKAQSQSQVVSDSLKIGQSLSGGKIYYKGLIKSNYLVYKDQYSPFKNKDASNTYYLNQFNNLFELTELDWRLPSSHELFLLKDYFIKNDIYVEGLYWTSEQEGDSVKCVNMSSDDKTTKLQNTFKDEELKGLFVKEILF